MSHRPWRAVVVLALALVMLAGCTSMKIDDFANRTPPLELERFFAGRSEGWGVMQSRSGTLLQQFRIEAEGSFDEATQTLRLEETYRFDDGHVDVLDWTIRRLGPGRYEGSEPRLTGPAQGEQAGNAFHWTYRRDVPQKEGGPRRLAFDDWFWLQPGPVLISRASVSRFGVELGTLSVFYRKP
jgi:hypothetical protein